MVTTQPRATYHFLILYGANKALRRGRTRNIPSFSIHCVTKRLGFWLAKYKRYKIWASQDLCAVCPVLQLGKGKGPRKGSCEAKI